jgi:hypothetical protein
MHSWFSNQIFNLFVILYCHEIFFIATEIIAMKLLPVAIWPIIIKKCLLQHGLVQRNNICGNNTYCHEIIYEAIEPTDVK